MRDKPVDAMPRETHSRPPADFQDHLAELEARGLLVRIDRPINKDTELHPLVRWQFVGGIAEEDAARLPVHQRHGWHGPALRHAGRGRRARRLAATSMRSAWAAGRGDRAGLDARHRPSDRRRPTSTPRHARRW